MSSTGEPLFRLGSFSVAGGPPFPAMVVGNRVYAFQGLRTLERKLGLLVHPVTSMLDLLGRWQENLPALRALAQALTSNPLATGVPIETLRTHPPVVPRQIFQAGANYHKHVVDLIVDGALARDPSIDVERVRADASEMMRKRALQGKPFIFMGLASSLTGPCDPIVIPARRVRREKALDHVAGYVIANDITARERVARPDAPQMGMDWMASKGAPTFLPVGPLLTPAEFVADPQDLRITLRLNGELMQDESTADMIFPVARIIEFISESVQLLPGDLVLTGSPP